jgi:ATP-binding cassette subfamily C protein
MRVLVEFVRGYPWASAFVLFFLVVASAAEGISIGALLPLLAFAMANEAAPEAEHDGLSRGVLDALARVGIEPSVGVLVAVVVCGLTLKSGLDLVAYRHVGYTIARVATDLRLSLVRALLAVRWEYFLGQPVGRFTNAMSSEADRAAKTYFNGAKFVATAIQLCVYAGVALFVSWQATLIYLASAAAIAVLLHRLVRVARRSG